MLYVLQNQDWNVLQNDELGFDTRKIGAHRIRIRTLSDESRNDETINDESKLEAFWKNFDKMLVEDKEKQGMSSKGNLYHHAVIRLLNDYKFNKKKKKMNLYHLQRKIESLTGDFKEKSIFKSYPELIQILTGQKKKKTCDNKKKTGDNHTSETGDTSDKMKTAKDYLKECDLSEDDLGKIHHLGQYTLEAIIINVLGSMFNSEEILSAVRVSTLIEQIDAAVNVQARIMGYINNAASHTAPKLDSMDKKTKKATRKTYNIGVGMINFMIDRELISLDSSINSDEFPKKKCHKYYKNSRCLATCNFDLSTLPIKFNLPMVYPPVDWHSKEENPSKLSQMQGGYLIHFRNEFFKGFRLLSSRNAQYFNIEFESPDCFSKVLNNLQSQAFEINKKVLNFIQENRNTLEEKGLLMNRVLANVNLQEASDLLRFCYVSDEGMKEVCSLNALLSELVRRVQQARYEDFVITLADAYSGYHFYLPAFMDFRGRIYRAGVLHFHERDLSKSLIRFVIRNDKKPEQELTHDKQYDLRMQLAAAAAFKYKKFSSIKEALDWYLFHYKRMNKSNESLINSALQASDPFQFIAKVISNENVSDAERIQGLNRVPVTQDASASAYQIMSYFLLNKELGMRTNLLPSPEPQIQDFYFFLKEELQEFFHSKLDTNKYAIIQSLLTRKLVKVLFMPLIYGKTVIAMASDIREVYGSLLSFKDSFYIAQLCHQFLITKYPGIVNLMKLINLVGWYCSMMNKSVRYTIPYFTTVQDYMRSEKADIWIYDRVCKKRRRITLRVETSDRDKRKTAVSTCVNFIHQKDAYIAIKVVEELTINTKAPIYTVHDNFITTSIYAKEVPQIYTNVFLEMDHPLKIINEFMNLNLNFKDFEYLLIRQNISDYFDNNLNYPISGSSLSFMLITQLPKDLKENPKCLNKISEIVRCYEVYANTVCGPEKLYEFKRDLLRWRSLDCNYSVHY